MTAIRMPDLRARHEPHEARAVRLPDLGIPDALRHLSRADGMAVSTALTAVGAALAWWLPGEGSLSSLGLALVVLGPLAMLATLTFVPPTMADDDNTAAPDTATVETATADTATPDTADIDARLPVLALQHSVRPVTLEPASQQVVGGM